MSLLNDIYYLLNKIFGVFVSRNIYNSSLVNIFEPYIHLMESSLSFFKTQYKLSCTVLYDGVYMKWEVSEYNLPIIDEEYIYMWYFHPIIWKNIGTNCLTIFAGIFAGNIFVIANIFILI